MNKVIYLVVAIAAVVIGAMAFKQINQQQLPENALYYKQARTVEPFSLTSHSQEVFDNAKLAGKWSLVFFGYTSCPDVCPTTLQEINFVYPDLKQVAPNTQVLLVSVDPNRDKPEKLAQYIAYFNKEFIALTAGHDVLYPFARNLGLMYAIVEDTDKEHYLVDHSASVVLINPQGKIAAIFKPQHELGQVPAITGDNLVADFSKIVALSG